MCNWRNRDEITVKEKQGRYKEGTKILVPFPRSSISQMLMDSRGAVGKRPCIDHISISIRTSKWIGFNKPGGGYNLKEGLRRGLELIFARNYFDSPSPPCESNFHKSLP